MNYEIECTNCGWVGDYTELVAESDDSVEFNCCPDCELPDYIEEFECDEED